MRRTLRLLAIGGTILLLSAGLIAACDDGDDGEEDGEPTATEEQDQTPADGTAEDQGDETGAVHISLTEWAITGEDGVPVPAVDAGEVTFEVHNDGQTPHELVIIKTDTDPADLPVESGKVDEDAAGEFIGEVEEFAGGLVEIGSYDLEPGNYALVCNIPAHYEQGMFAGLTVE